MINIEIIDKPSNFLCKINNSPIYFFFLDKMMFATLLFFVVISIHIFNQCTCDFTPKQVKTQRVRFRNHKDWKCLEVIGESTSSTWQPLHFAVLSLQTCNSTNDYQYFTLDKRMLDRINDYTSAENYKYGWMGSKTFKFWDKYVVYNKQVRLEKFDDITWLIVQESNQNCLTLTDWKDCKINCYGPQEGGSRNPFPCLSEQKWHIEDI